MSRQYSIAQARSSLPALVHSVEDGPPVELTRRGRPVAVLLSLEEYERLQRKTPDFWEAVETFRRDVDLEALDAASVYADVRDRSPGRKPDF